MPDLCDALSRWTPPRGAMARWQEREPALADVPDLDALAAHLLDRGTPHDARDDLLAALVRLARADGDAATAVIVCLLPGIRRHAHRMAATGSRGDACAEMVAQTLAHVRRYDLRRRPRRIAANLLLDAMSHTLDARAKDHAWSAMTVRLDDVTLPPAPVDELDPLEEAVELGLLTRHDAALIGATRCNGLDLGTAAALVGLSYEAAKKRRQRAEARLVRWLDGDQAA